MMTQMPLQIGALSKSTCTVWTHEGSFELVNVAHMALHVGGDAEASIALTAAVGLFARVRAQMAVEVGGAWKHLVTVWTLVARLSGPRNCLHCC